MHRDPASRYAGDIRRRRGFTLVELLVVMVVIGILVAATIKVGTSVIDKGKSNLTEATLKIAADAVEQFRRDEPVFATARWGTGTYKDRYGLYPPDELEVFSLQGLAAPAGGSPLKLVRSVSAVEPAPTAGPTYAAMNFYTDVSDPATAAIEHRDLAAMILAIDRAGGEAAVHLSRIPKRYRAAGPVDGNGRPVQFFDTNGDGAWDSDVDDQILYIVDDWGMPISYLAQRDWRSGGTNLASSNHAMWNKASTEMIRVNSGRPILMSYGPNGRDQLTAEAMGNNAEACLVTDWAGIAIGTTAGRIDHPLNADNVYADELLAEQLSAAGP